MECPGNTDTNLDGALTIDLEDWRLALTPRATGNRQERPSVDESYIKECTRGILTELEKRGTRATFFVLGEVAEAVPEIVKEISRRNHEIASHSHAHVPICSVPRRDLMLSIQRDLDLLENLSGRRPIGFRAPYFSVRRHDGWFLEALSESGLQYDSSVVPTWTPIYGIPFAQKGPYYPDFADISKIAPRGRMLELPISVWPSWGRFPGLPMGGGFFLRFWPTPAVITVLKRNLRTGVQLMIYVHPTDIEPESSEAENLGISDRTIQNFGKRRGIVCFRRILDEFKLGPICRVFSPWLIQPK